MDTATIIIAVGVLMFAAHLFAAFFERTNIPDVLPLFLIGIILGPISGQVTPEMLMSSGPIFATMTLVIVLFVGGLDIRIDALARSFGKAALLMLLNVGGTTVVVSLLAWLFYGLHPLQGAIVGILVGGTSSAIVVPIARRLGLHSDTRTLLSVESNLNVVLSVILAFALWDVWQGIDVEVWRIPFTVLLSFAGSLLIGVLTAFLWAQMIGAVRELENYLFTTPAFLFVVYGLTELLSADGIIAAFAFGIMLGNVPLLAKRTPKLFPGLEDFRLMTREREFYSSLTFVLKAFFFIYMGILIDLGRPLAMFWAAGVMIVLYAWRYVITGWVLDDAPGRDLNVARSMLPKGLVGAAVLVLIGDPDLEQLAYPIIFMSVIMTSVLLYFMRGEGGEPRPTENTAAEDLPAS